MLFNTLLTLHIAAGFTALITAFIAVLSKLLDTAHRWHIHSGRIYFWAMFIIFATAIPMSILRPNLFLFLVSIFSFYFALSGWRLAKNRRGTPEPIDWIRAVIMCVTACAMILYGAYMLINSNTNGITLLVFGLFGGNAGYRDFNRLRAGGIRGKARIAQHLNSMMGATIATVTAFVVTNFTYEPAFVLWLGPAVVITPFIFWWNRQLRAGRQVKGLETAVLAEQS